MGIKGIEHLVGDPVTLKVYSSKRKIPKNIQTAGKSKSGKKKKN